jgi:L-alanine-DL-glutamate epimerase-like enolase superfamily enzyme
LLLGQDATAVEALWQRMWQGTYRIGRMGAVLMSLSAVDIALWDALGKRAGLPLFRLWGGDGSKAQAAYGTGCWREMGGDGMIEKARRYVARGFKAIKMQASHTTDLAGDVTNVRRMREAMGPAIDIMIDINQGWSADVAILMGKKFEPYDLYWFEEPVPPHDFVGYRRVAQALNMRVVGGEAHYTRWDLPPLLENGLIPILQPEVMRGGLTELRKIAATADTWGVKIAPHQNFELNSHVMATIPNGLILEMSDQLADLWVEPVVPVDGKVRPPERPGHGLRFKPDLVREYTLKK